MKKLFLLIYLFVNTLQASEKKVVWVRISRTEINYIKRKLPQIIEQFSISQYLDSKNNCLGIQLKKLDNENLLSKLGFKKNDIIIGVDSKSSALPIISIIYEEETRFYVVRDGALFQVRPQVYED